MHKHQLTWQNHSTAEGTLISKKAADKKKRTKTPMKRQFKVRLIEKSLPVNTESEAVATITTLMQMPVVVQTTTTTKPSPIPVMVYNLAQSKIHEIPNPARKFQEEESPFTPNCSNPPMVQQPKATATATSTAPLTRDDTSWPNTMPASTNLLQGHHGQFPQM